MLQDTPTIPYSLTISTSRVKGRKEIGVGQFSAYSNTHKVKEHSENHSNTTKPYNQ